MNNKRGEKNRFFPLFSRYLTLYHLFPAVKKKHIALELFGKQGDRVVYLLFYEQKKVSTVEPRFNEVAGDRPNLFVKWRVRYIENLDITNLRVNDQKVRYIEVIVND